MLTYKTHFCTALYVEASDDLETVRRIHEAYVTESAAHGHEVEFSVSYHPRERKPHILLTDKEGLGRIEHVCAFVFECAMTLGLDGTWALPWAETSEKPTTNGNGGGVVYLDLARRSMVFFDSTDSWLEDQIQVRDNADQADGFDRRTVQLETVLYDLTQLTTQVLSLLATVKEKGSLTPIDLEPWIRGVSPLQARAEIATEALMRRNRAAHDLLATLRGVFDAGTVQPVFNAFVVPNPSPKTLDEPEIVTRLRQALGQLDGH